jgi:hypothetical protein
VAYETTGKIAADRGAEESIVCGIPDRLGKRAKPSVPNSELGAEPIAPAVTEAGSTRRPFF